MIDSSERSDIKLLGFVVLDFFYWYSTKQKRARDLLSSRSQPNFQKITFGLSYLNIEYSRSKLNNLVIDSKISVTNNQMERRTTKWYKKIKIIKASQEVSQSFIRTEKQFDILIQQNKFVLKGGLVEGPCKAKAIDWRRQVRQSNLG